MDGGVVPFIIAVLIVAVLIFVAILLTGKRGGHLLFKFLQKLGGG